ncbi:MAG: DNA adenine methylase [Proteobacteria bacterium]|nr:DNA adenine methylase [Pseudomonadota bacterium]MBU2226672.1 DNA adenine methylase [Pseudomonadota bacterium]MBU2261067.1 DNA adenine methylase [Pseudomonadota bacterium]
MKKRTLPHPIPYQGSKRNLANEILRYFPSKFVTLYEPFAGSAAITIATAVNGIGNRYYINDLNKPLMDLWRAIIETPEQIASYYEALWRDQLDDPRSFYNNVRGEFNRTGRPDLFLYLLARCVKGSVRYNSQGEFNQSPDNRRKGMKPDTMRLQVLGASYFLKGKTSISSVNYRDVLNMVTPNDLVYMDPPYQGVCGNKDTRYLQSVQLCEFVEALDALNQRGIRYLVSYDGRTGDKTFGKSLPNELNLTLIELYAGRSSQATLLGRDEVTIESLYLSPSLADELARVPIVYRYTRGEQLCLMEGRNKWQKTTFPASS